MKNKYTIAYIGAIIALPVALLFIVPAVATTNAFDWNGGNTMDSSFADAEQSFAEAQQNVFSGFGDTATQGSSVAPEAMFTTSSNQVTGFGASAGASSGSTGASGSTNTNGGGSAWATNSGYANANASVDLGCIDCDIPCETPAPTCVLNALPATIHEGDAVKLVWDTNDATAVSIAGIGSVVLDGSKDLYPTHSQSYTLTATGEGGTATCVKSVQVIPKDVVHPAPLCTFSINPASITEGGAATFTWDTTNATTVSIDTIGAVTVDGTKVVYPTQTKNYELTATGNGGTVKCTDSIQVTPKTTHVKCDSFTASKSHIKKGEAVVLAWNTTDAQSVLINEGVGTVALDGNTTVNLFRDTTFTLTARNGSEINTCQVSVGVDAENTTTGTTTFTNVNNNYNYNYNSNSGGSSHNNNNNDNVRCDSFTVSDSHVEEGDKVTLRWKTTDADDVEINQGVGDVDDDGSETVTIKKDTIFTLTARDGSDKDTCRVSVKVDDDEDDDDNNNDKLRCEFSVSDSAIRTGESVILSWINDAADRLVLKDNNGKTLADSKKDKDIDEDVDFLTVKPTKTTKYTLDVYDGNKKETCVLNVAVGKGTVSGISLSQVPYTGFEAGPMLTAIFYGAIVLWGLVLAYALVLKKKHPQILSK